jgi:succinate dehydrogenase/fumarate reductase iron-sulfur protein
MRILGVLNYIRENLDSSLAYRYSCRYKRCGACAIMVNGEPKLACYESAEEKMVIEPLANFPVIRDLVVDRGSYDAITERMDLSLHRSKLPDFPERIPVSEHLKLYQLDRCLECLACVSACPKYGEGKGFAGPAALVQLARFQLDPRDELDRTKQIIGTHIEECGSCGDCQRACPENIPVLTVAIDELRDTLVKEGVYYIRWWSFIRRMPIWVRSLVKCKLGLTSGEHFRVDRDWSKQ